MKLKTNQSQKPLTKFDKFFGAYLLLIIIIFLATLTNGFLTALAISMILLALFGIAATLFKKSAARDTRQGIAIIAAILFIAGFLIMPAPDSSRIANLSLAVFMLGLVLLLTGLVNPSLFSPFSKKARPSRLKLAAVFGTLVIISLFGAGMTATPALASINLSEQQDVLSEKYTIEGTYTGSPSSISINGENLELEGSAFRKDVLLNEGNNQITVVMKKEDQTLHSETYDIYYDYEGSLYAEILKKEQREAEELKKTLARVPAYEIVRKENMPDGFSAIVYLDSDPEGYLVTNAIKHIKYYHTDTKAISLLVFQKSDKPAVEKILDSTDVSELSAKIRADYEKRPDKEELFLFPSGLESTKLALEV